MSSMPGNPYATEDAIYTEDANNSSVVNATLALAYEQRTANLIALRTLHGQVIASGWTVSETMLEQLANIDSQLQERLGL